VTQPFRPAAAWHDASGGRAMAGRWGEVRTWGSPLSRVASAPGVPPNPS